VIEGDALAVGLNESPRRAWKKSLRRFERRLTDPLPQSADQQLDPKPDGTTALFVETEPDQSQVDWHRLFERGCDDIEQGKHHMGVALLTRVVHRVPGNAEAWHKLGFAYGELGRSSQAIECFDRVIALQPRWAEAWNNRGWNKLQNKQVGLAVVDFTTSLSIDPTNAGPWSNLAQAYKRSKQIQSASDAYRMACKYDELNESYWFDWAKCQVKLGNPQGAISGFRRACILNPGFVASWFQLICLTRDANDWPHSDELAKPRQVSRVMAPTELPNMGKVLPREHHFVSRRAEDSQARWQKAWLMIQNPVSWIIVLIFAALLYVLLGK